MNNRPPRILLVDDEPAVLSALARLLHRQLPAGPEVETFTSPRAALARAWEVPFALVVSDYRMAEMDGIAFLKEFAEIQPHALRQLVRNPSRVRNWPTQLMPGFGPAQISDADLDDLLAYLAHMAQQRRTTPQ